jgi:hypothetical protein
MAGTWYWSLTSNQCRSQKYMVLYIHSSIRLQGVVLNYLSTGTTSLTLYRRKGYLPWLNLRTPYEACSGWCNTAATVAASECLVPVLRSVAMHFPTPQSNLSASPSPRIASIVNDLPIVLDAVALIGGLGLSPLLLLLEVRACWRSAEYMNSDDGAGPLVPVAGPLTVGGYCWCRKSRKCENEVYPNSGVCIIMLGVVLSMKLVGLQTQVLVKD